MSRLPGFAKSHRDLSVGRWLIATLVGAVLVGACSAAPSTASPEAVTSPSPGVAGTRFGPEDVTAAVQTLAASGVAVRIAPGDAPLQSPAGESRVALLRFQVRNLALEASGGGGFRGSELDELAIANGGLPVSYLIAAWAGTAGTPAALAAAKLLGPTESVDPPTMRVPGLAAALFLADVLPGPAAATGRPRLAALGQTGVAAGGSCDEVGAYLSGVLDGMLDPTQALAPAWLQGAIDRYALLENDPVKLRNAVAATAILVYAISISRPWAVTMTYSPLGEAHYIVGEDELTVAPKEVRIAINPGDGSFAEEVKGCAALADAQLAETEIEDSPVVWFAPGIERHATEGEDDDVDDELDAYGTAAYAYQTKGETDETHKNGTLQSETVVATAIIERQDIAALKTLVDQLLTGSGFLAPNVRAVYDRLKPRLDSLLYPRGWQAVEISWHEEPTPTPPPAASPQGAIWSMVFWPTGFDDSVPPILAAYTCDGLQSTWKAIYGPGSPVFERTFELPFGQTPTVRREFNYDIPPGGTSPAGKLDYSVDFELEAKSDPPVINVSGTRTARVGGQTNVQPPREFGSDAPLVLRNVSLETQLAAYPQYQHPFRAQALQECGK